MFDVGWQELFIVAAIAIIVVGPRDLPRVLKTVMSVVRKARTMAREFQGGIDDVVREVELDDLRKQANSIVDMDLEDEVKSALDPDGDLSNELDMTDVEKTMQDTAEQINTTPDAVETDTYVGSTETLGGAGPVEPDAPIENADATDNKPPQEASS